MLRKIFLYILVILPVVASANDVNITMSAPNIVSIGDQFRLTISINEDGDPKLPEINNFEVLYGPSVSKSSSIQIINGKQTSSREFSYTYILQAKTEGKFTINPATVVIGNNTFTSNKVEIQVVKGRDNQQNGNSASNTSGASNQNNLDNAQMSKDDLFARIILSKNKAFKGEQIIATIKLYASPNIPIAGFGDVSFPSFEGFYTQNIERPQQIEFEREAYNNKVYQVGIIKQLILFPQQTGEIKITPFDIECLIRKRVGGSQGGFFGGMFDNYTTVSSKIISNSASVSVKDIPAAPTNFYGGVGNMSMTATIDKTEAKSNDAITLKVIIKGSGNLRLVEAPKIEFPEDFEIYDPKKTENLTETAGGQNGTITFEYLIIPRYAGKYTIPAISFVSFNPQDEKFNTSNSNAFELNIAKGDGDQNTSVITNNLNPSNKEDLKHLGSDIRYIKQNKIKFVDPNKTFYGSLAFWLTYIISSLTFIVIAVIYRKKLKEIANTSLYKNKQANKVAQKRLKAAANFMKQHKHEEFYEAILKAFWGYLSDKLGIPVSELNRDNVSKNLANHLVTNESIDEFINIINVCEFARYAPSSSDAAIEELYNKSASLMGKLDKKIR